MGLTELMIVVGAVGGFGGLLCLKILHSDCRHAMKSLGKLKVQSDRLEGSTNNMAGRLRDLESRVHRLTRTGGRLSIIETLSDKFTECYNCHAVVSSSRTHQAKTPDLRTVPVCYKCAALKKFDRRNKSDD